MTCKYGKHCCLYPGSFDPVTVGHLDIIKRAAAIFDTVVVGVLHNPDKLGCFSVEQRMDMLRRACEGIHNVEIIAWPGLLALGAGTCTRCKECTYPDAPCRFPDKRVSSMEACGLVVMDTCKANGLGYYYGPQSIAYTSCFLLE